MKKHFILPLMLVCLAGCASQPLTVKPQMGQGANGAAQTGPSMTFQNQQYVLGPTYTGKLGAKIGILNNGTVYSIPNVDAKQEIILVTTAGQAHWVAKAK